MQGETAGARLRRDRLVERGAFGCLWAAALLTIATLALILLTILGRGLPGVTWEFLTASPQNLGRDGGIFPTLVGTVAIGLLALLIAAPLGVGTAIYLTEYTVEGWLTRAVRFGTESLSGVPSIIFGLFGFIFFVTYLQMGWSVLAGALTLALMVLPTIIRVAEEAIRTVPHGYRDVSFSLGATRWQMVTSAVLPSALPGIMTGIILAFGRAVSETAVVIFTAGTSLNMPSSPLSPARTMAVHFYILAVEGISLPKAYATGAVLVIAILLINVVANAALMRLTARTRRR